MAFVTFDILLEFTLECVLYLRGGESMVIPWVPTIIVIIDHLSF